MWELDNPNRSEVPLIAITIDPRLYNLFLDDKLKHRAIEPCFICPGIYNAKRQKQPLISFLVRKKNLLRIVVRRYFARKWLLRIQTLWNGDK